MSSNLFLHRKSRASSANSKIQGRAAAVTIGTAKNRSFPANHSAEPNPVTPVTGAEVRGAPPKKKRQSKEMETKRKEIAGISVDGDSDRARDSSICSRGRLQRIAHAQNEERR
jgi:hypothetical protein